MRIAARWPLWIGIATVVAVNGLALTGVWMNRRSVENTIVLDERDLELLPREREDSALMLRWRLPRRHGALPVDARRQSWGTFPCAQAVTLGFDCEAPADMDEARRFCARQGLRRAVVVLEVNGPERAAYLAAWKAMAQEILARPRSSDEGDPGELQQAIARADAGTAQLLPVDLGRDPVSLRARYPDKARHLLLFGLVELEPSPPASDTGGPRIEARLQTLEPAVLQVPLGVRSALAPFVPPRAAPPPDARRLFGMPPLPGSGTPPRYRITLQVGQRLQPWISEGTSIR